MKYEDADRTHYRLKTFANVSEAHADGYTITHHNPCGACSSTVDLALYMEQRDLTNPGISCGLQGLIHRILGIQCFIRLICHFINRFIHFFLHWDLLSVTCKAGFHRRMRNGVVLECREYQGLTLSFSYRNVRGCCSFSPRAARICVGVCVSGTMPFCASRSAVCYLRCCSVIAALYSLPHHRRRGEFESVHTM